MRTVATCGSEGSDPLQLPLVLSSGPAWHPQQVTHVAGSPHSAWKLALWLVVQYLRECLAERRWNVCLVHWSRGRAQTLRLF